MILAMYCSMRNYAAPENHVQLPNIDSPTFDDLTKYILIENKSQTLHMWPVKVFQL